MLPEDVPSTRHGEVDRDRGSRPRPRALFELFRAGPRPAGGGRQARLRPLPAGPLGPVRGRRRSGYLASLPRGCRAGTVAVEFRHRASSPSGPDEVVALPRAATASSSRRVDAALAAVRRGGDDARLVRPPAARPERPGLARPAGRPRADGGREVRLPLRCRRSWASSPAGPGALHRHARRVAVTFNNNNEDFPVQNALDLKRLLGLDAPGRRRRARGLAAGAAALVAERAPAGAGALGRRGGQEAAVHERACPERSRPVASSRTGSSRPAASGRGSCAAGQVLRIVDLEGRQAVDFLCYSAADPSERYNAADTMKFAGTIFLTTGHVLYSGLGRRLFTIVADSCGRHDTIGGCCSARVQPRPLRRRGDAELPGQFPPRARALRAGPEGHRRQPELLHERPGGGRRRDGDRRRVVEARRPRGPPGGDWTCWSPCPTARRSTTRANGGRPTPIRLVTYAPAGEPAVTPAGTPASS